MGFFGTFSLPSHFTHLPFGFLFSSFIRKRGVRRRKRAWRKMGTDASEYNFSCMNKCGNGRGSNSWDDFFTGYFAGYGTLYEHHFNPTIPTKSDFIPVEERNKKYEWGGEKKQHNFLRHYGEINNNKYKTSIFSSLILFLSCLQILSFFMGSAFDERSTMSRS